MALINYITQVQLDFGAVKLLPQECERIGNDQRAPDADALALLRQQLHGAR